MTIPLKDDRKDPVRTFQILPDSPPSLARDGAASGAKLTREQKRTKALGESLPAGITIGERKGRKKPFFVRFGPDRKVESFSSELDRNDRAEALARAAAEQGKAILDFDPSELRAWNEFRKETGATIEQLRALWTRFHPLVKASMPTKDAIASYMALRLKEDVREKTDTYRQMRKHLVDCLASYFGGLPLAKITAEDLRRILDELKDRRGKGEASSTTKRNYRKDWNTFFDRAVRERWIHENPCASLVPPRVDEKDKALLSVRDAFHLLKTNLLEPVTPRIALEMFGFLRCSAAGRIRKEHVNLEERGIVMPGALHKSGRRKYRQGHPDVLWAWLSIATDDTWDLSERMYDQRKGEAFRRAGVVNSGNVLRHSCISYHLAAFKDFKTTSYLAQHVHSSTTAGYEGIARQSDARLWLLLTPENVALTWEQFLAKYEKSRPALHGDASANPAARDRAPNAPSAEADLGGDWSRETGFDSEDPALAEGQAPAGTRAEGEPSDRNSEEFSG